MQVSKVPYPVWHILPDRRADNPESVREAVKFIAKHKLFHVKQTQDAKHLAWLFAATDLAATGLSESEIKTAVAFENANPVLYMGKVNKENCYETLRAAIIEGYADIVADCLIFLNKGFRRRDFFLSLPEENNTHPEAESLISTMMQLSETDVHIYKQNSHLKISFASYSPYYERHVHYLSLFVPVHLGLGKFYPNEKDFKALKKSLPYLKVIP